MEDLIKRIDTASKTLFILCGLPYAGKSFTIKAICERVAVTVVSIDQIFSSRGFDWTLNRLPDAEAWKEIFEASYTQTREALANNQVVLYDSTNHTRASRDILRSIAREVGAQAYIIWIQTDPETIWKRWEEARRTKTRSLVARELVQMTIDAFESPEAEENLIQPHGVKS